MFHNTCRKRPAFGYSILLFVPATCEIFLSILLLFRLRFNTFNYTCYLFMNIWSTRVRIKPAHLTPHRYTLKNTCYKQAFAGFCFSKFSTSLNTRFSNYKKSLSSFVWLPPVLFKKYFFNFMYMYACLSACMCTLWVQVSWEARRASQKSWNWGYKQLWAIQCGF